MVKRLYYLLMLLTKSEWLYDTIFILNTFFWSNDNGQSNTFNVYTGIMVKQTKFSIFGFQIQFLEAPYAKNINLKP